MRVADGYQHVKTFEAVSVVQKKACGSRNSTECLRADSPVVKDFLAEVQSIPRDEAIIVAAFKARGKQKRGA